MRFEKYANTNQKFFSENDLAFQSYIFNKYSFLDKNVSVDFEWICRCHWAQKIDNYLASPATSVQCPAATWTAAPSRPPCCRSAATAPSRTGLPSCRPRRWAAAAAKRSAVSSSSWRGLGRSWTRPKDFFHHLLATHFPSACLSATLFCKDWLPMIRARKPIELNHW